MNKFSSMMNKFSSIKTYHAHEKYIIGF